MRVSLPNGLEVESLVRGEAENMYREIFVERLCLRHGLELRDGACIVDIGANIGMFTLFALDCCKPSMVYAYEPVPPVYEALRANVEKRSAVRTFNLAVGADTEPVDITFYPGASMLSTTFPDRDHEAARFRANLESTHPDWDADALDFFTERAFATPQRFRCAVKPLSQIVREESLDRIDLLKIDVEKAEHLVLRGMDDSVFSKVRQMVVEVYDEGGRVATIAAHLQHHGLEPIVEPHPGVEAERIFEIYARRRG